MTSFVGLGIDATAIIVIRVGEIILIVGIRI